MDTNLLTYLLFSFIYRVPLKTTFEVKAGGTDHAVGATEWQKTGWSHINRFTQQLRMPLVAVVQCLFPQQTWDVVHPVAPNLCRRAAQRVRGTRKTLTKPQLKRVASVTDVLRQTNIRRLQLQSAENISTAQYIIVQACCYLHDSLLLHPLNNQPWATKHCQLPLHTQLDCTLNDHLLSTAKDILT